MLRMQLSTMAEQVRLPFQAQWRNALVGNLGTGILQITGGGKLTSTNSPFPVGSVIGSSTGADGTVTVSGNGSQWTNTGTLWIGASGEGRLTIADGGIVSNTHAFVGSEIGSEGTVMVTGNGSKWTNSSSLSLGRSGTGSLTVADGGMVSCFFGNIAGFVGSGQGTLLVTGQGSTLTSDNWLEIGDRGTGKLTISDGGLVKVAGNTSLGAPSELGALPSTRVRWRHARSKLAPSTFWAKAQLTRAGWLPTST